MNLAPWYIISCPKRSKGCSAPEKNCRFVGTPELSNHELNCVFHGCPIFLRQILDRNTSVKTFMAIFRWSRWDSTKLMPNVRSRIQAPGHGDVARGLFSARGSKYDENKSSHFFASKLCMIQHLWIYRQTI